ncbi:hypothetical protein N7U49_12440 [Streptomyces sp. AD2-2]|nr:hypothetical protein N7U49_12440 [Streptomyces sp. AD2-2]
MLYPPDDRWQGRELRPYPAGDWAPGDAFGEAATALTEAGLEVHTWVVLAHNSRLGAAHPDTSVVNAYGDRYLWAPCIAQPATRAYLVDLAAEAAVRPGARGTELESLGWYGLAHLHAHDKTAGVGLGDAGQYLMSLCFCPTCREGYGEHGLDAQELAAAVRAALAPVWRGHPPTAAGRGSRNSSATPTRPPPAHGATNGPAPSRRRPSQRSAPPHPPTSRSCCTRTRSPTTAAPTWAWTPGTSSRWRTAWSSPARPARAS